ncbi:CPBP family intramembrane glutamic endopeptidase [Chitinolyticbacter albus]|uniref:CPBP family intramembrane glutamic endopeptidase n=1 Tax=Chitinolyticbacter albus TaxID=2961951 RepID=UPI00210B1197|nr:CPBP family intramembrane glutamic endopeptidase [Chitinolyticbacter albus]
MHPYWLALPLWATVLALWWPGRALFCSALALTVAIAVGCGWLAWWALPLLGAGWWLRRQLDQQPHWQWHALLVVWVLSGALHWWPGLNNPLLLDSVQVSVRSMPYSLYVNLDKTIVGLALLSGAAWRVARSAPWRWHPGLIALPLVLALVLWLACAAGLIAPEPGCPPWAPLWAACNLLMTCVAEEACFRFYLQRQLAGACGQPMLAVIVAGLAFGVAHLGGGGGYAALAAIAGICYGLAYQWSGRLEAAIVLHFLFNAAHLCGFTYPLLRP